MGSLPMGWGTTLARTWKPTAGLEGPMRHKDIKEALGAFRSYKAKEERESISLYLHSAVTVADWIQARS